MKHIYHVELLGFDYLLENENYSLSDANEDHVENFFLNWYFHKFLNANKHQIKEVLTSIKKFFEYMLETEEIDQDRFKRINKICSNPKRLYRLQTLRNSLHLQIRDEKRELYDWTDDDHPWRQEYESTIRNENVDLLQDAFLKIKNVPPPHDMLKFVEEFDLLLNFCIKHEGIKLTKNGQFAKNDLESMQRLLTKPESTGNNGNEQNSLILHLFRLVGKKLEWFKIDLNNKLKMMPNAKQYLKLSTLEKFFLIFDVFWNRINWQELLNSRELDNNEKILCLQRLLVHILDLAKPGVEHELNSLFKVAILKSLITKNEIDMARHCDELQINDMPMQIIPILEKMGLVKLKRQSTSKNKMHGDQVSTGKMIKTLVLDSWGKNFFKTIFNDNES